MGSIDRLADYLIGINYVGLQHLHLEATVPEFFILTEEEGQMDLTDVRWELKETLLKRKPAWLSFTLDTDRQLPQTIRVLVDGKAPVPGGDSFTHVKLSITNGNTFSVTVKDRTWENSRRYHSLHVSDTTIFHCWDVATYAKKLDNVEWHINLPEKDVAYIEELKSVFVGWGYDCTLPVEPWPYPTLDAKESFLAQRDGKSLLVLLDRRVTLMGNNRFLLLTK